MMRAGIVRFWRNWQFAWAVLGPILALTGLIYTMWPQVTVTTSPTLDPTGETSATGTTTDALCASSYH
jgi:hypothetical protein